MAGAQPVYTGNCFYGGGGIFRAQLFGKVWDEVRQRETRVKYVCDEPLVLEVLRQAFELLGSEDTQRRIGDKVVKKIFVKGSELPIVCLDCGRTTYQLTAAKRGTGAAKLEAYLPFSTVDEDLDLTEIAEVPNGEEGEGDTPV